MSQLALLEIFLRGGAVATFLLCAVFFARTRPATRKSAAVATLCLALCAYLLISSPGLGVTHGPPFTLLFAISATVPVLVYWAALEFFQDEAPWALWQSVLCALIVGTAWLSLSPISLDMIRGLGVVILLLHLLATVGFGEAGDLVAARRRFRRWFLVVVVVVALVTTVFETTGLDRDLPRAAYAAHAAVFWLLAATFLLWAARLDPLVWPGDARTAPATEGLSPAETALIPRIEAAMKAGLWQQEGLTVSQMAQALNTQDHRLRKTINQGLGHRNFASFVNGYRLERAKTLLRDPALADRTVLSIAYEVGFASLGPFNRAFRGDTGMSPTQYRKATMSGG